MNNQPETRSERYLRFSQRRLLVTLIFVLAIGGGVVATAIWPTAPGLLDARRPLQLLVIVFTLWLFRSLGDDRWDSRRPEARAIVEDEWRRSNMDRARRVAFAVVLVAQLPLGLMLASLPPARALMAMGGATITLGLATMLARFLYLDRDTADGR